MSVRVPAWAAVLAASWVLLQPAGTATAEEESLIEVRLPAAGQGDVDAHVWRQTWQDWLRREGFAFNRCGHRPREGTMLVESSSPDALERLLDAGFTMARSTIEPLPDGQPRTADGYYAPQEIDAILDAVAAAHPNITRLFTIGTTFEGRSIRAIEISNHPGVAEDEPAIQFNGQHHAREVATSHIVVDVVQTLTDGYGTDPLVTEYVDAYKTICVPMVNPDGVQHVFDVDPGWRKNRQLHSCVGVDLNRNYPYMWGPGCGSSGVCTSTTYRGPSAASELETLAMMALADEYHFVMATSYHAYGRFIDYPYACATGSPATLMPEHDVVHEMMNGMADAIDAVDSVPRYTVYSPVPFGGVNGDDTSWYYAHEGTYAFIVEVGTSFEPPFSQVAGIVNRNREGWRYLYARLDGPRIDVHVSDGCNGQPLEADVTLVDYAFDTGELPRQTFLPFGRWTYLVVGNNTYNVRASSAGYVTQEVSVVVGIDPAPANIVLERESPPPQIYGDADCDGDVDADDYALFESCLAGSGGEAAVVCDALDADGDADVDLRDFMFFQAAYGS